MTPIKRLVLTFFSITLISIFLSTLTTARIIQLSNDNGNFYQGSRAGRIRGDIDGALFTPDPDLFPIAIQSVEFAFHRPEGDDPIADSTRVRVQVYALEGGVPSELLTESTSYTFSTFDEWISLPLTTSLSIDEPTSFMAAVKWESGDNDEPAPSIATDSNFDAPQPIKDQTNLYHDANSVLRPSSCQTEFCLHSQFWAQPENVGFNMIRVTIDTPQAPTATPSEMTLTPTVERPDEPTPTATLPSQPTPSNTEVLLPAILRNFTAFISHLTVGDAPDEAIGYALTSGNAVAELCWQDTDNNLWVGREPDDERGIMRSVIWFDLSAVPSNAVLSEASLQLVVAEPGADAAPMAVSVHDVTRPWPDCPTWNTLGDAAGRSWGSLSVESDIEVYTIDVTALVENWLNGDLPNYGLMLRGDEEAENRVRGFVPTTSSQEDLRPSLSIQYHWP